MREFPFGSPHSAKTRRKHGKEQTVRRGKKTVTAELLELVTTYPAVVQEPVQ